MFQNILPKTCPQTILIHWLCYNLQSRGGKYLYNLYNPEVLVFPYFHFYATFFYFTAMIIYFLLQWILLTFILLNVKKNNIYKNMVER